MSDLAAPPGPTNEVADEVPQVQGALREGGCGTASERRPVAMLFALYGLSGAVGVSFEIACFRRLSLLTGVSHYASGALLAIFMAGLCAGALWAARKVRALAAPLRAYGAAEAGVGVGAWMGLAALDLADPTRGWSLLASGAFASVCLLPPTFAMGTTLAFMVAELERRCPSPRGLAMLYGTNVAGGGVGALVTGYLVLPQLGLRSALALIGAMALAVAAVAFIEFRLAGRSRPQPCAPSQQAHRNNAAPAARPPENGTRAAYGTALAVLVVLGFVSFVVQIALARAAALLLGATSATFALVLACTLLANGAGAAHGARASRSTATRTQHGARRPTAPRRTDERSHHWRVVSRRWLSLAIATYLAMICVHIAPYYVVRGHEAAVHPAVVRVAVVVLLTSYASFEVGRIFASASLLLMQLPTAAGGSARPSADAPSARHRRASLSGAAAFANTAGNVAGSLTAGFVLVPAVGVQATLGASSAVALAAAVLSAARGGRASAVGMVAAALVGTAFASVVTPAWDMRGLNSGAYRRETYRKATNQSQEVLYRDATTTCLGPPYARTRVRFAGDGAIGTVVVLEHDAGEGCRLVSLRINGKAEGSVYASDEVQPTGTARGARRDGPRWLPVGDLPSETMAGLLPSLAGDRTDDAFVMGWGTGITAGALVRAGVAAVHVAEIEPLVVEASRVFDPGLPEAAPVRIHEGDGRRWLARQPPASLDIIVSHPSNPWVSSSAALFSREYYTLSKSRLRPGGRVFTWLQLYEMDRASARTLVGTFVDVFPNAYAFRLGSAARDVLLLGFRDDAHPTRDALLAALKSSPNERRDLVRDALGEAAWGDVLRSMLADGVALARYADGALRETDDRSLLEVRLSRNVLWGESEPIAVLLQGLEP